MKVLLGMLIGGLLVALGMGVASAQNPLLIQNPLLSPYQINVPVSILPTLCQPVTGMASLCMPGDGSLYMSTNGGSFVKIGAAQAAALTLNGTTKTLPASFTIGATVAAN